MTKKKRPERMLTEVELEMMNVVWKSDRCTIRSVVDQLPKERRLAYTSVATMMKILEEKGFLTSVSHEKTHVFSPVIGKEEYERRTLNHVAEKLFEGSPSSMVMKLIDDADLSREELKAIQKTLEERLRS
jgi:predicted transcriptional regulator